MDKVKIISRLGAVLVGASALWLSGCAAEAGEGEAPEGDVDSVGQAIGTECAAAAPTASFVSAINYTSPQTYSTPNCFKGVVLDVTKYASTAPAGHSVFTGVGWADSVPVASQANHVADCNNLWLHADLFEIVNGVPVYVTSRDDHGTWLTDFPAANTCQGPSVSLTDLMTPGKAYRVSATARTFQSSSAPTRRLSAATTFLPTPR
ncbi:MAG TPA: hypothetical protein VFS43_29220 [Polyangiaceae bacterium]|nr:hypothetical protein [Polyangiaceae bacterium]